MLAQLRRNLLLLYTAEFLGKVLGLVVFGYLARVLLTARYGDLEFALGILFLLNLVIDAGLGHYGAREAAKYPEDTNRLVGQIAIVRGALIVVSLLLLAGASVLVATDPIARWLIVLQGLVLLPAPFILTWVFQARDEMHVVAAAALIRQVVLAVGVLLFVNRPTDVLLVPVWDAIGLSLGVGLQIVLFLRAGGTLRPVLSGIGTVLVESAPLAASSVVWAVRLFAPLLALGIFRTSTDVGIFGAGHRLVIAAHTFVWLYFFNLLPSLSRMGTEEGLRSFRDLFETSMRLVAWIAICGAALGSVLADVLIPLIYGEELAAAAAPFAVMVWILAVAFVSGHHRFSLIALSLQNKEFIASAVGAAVSVIGCVLLGDGLTPMNAAVVFLLAESATWIVATVFLRAHVRELAILRGIARPALLVMAGAAAVRIWSPESSLAAAAAMTVLFVAVIGATEQDDVRRLLDLRSEGAP